VADSKNHATTNKVAALLGSSQILKAGSADVNRVRERTRFRRVVRALLLVGALGLFLLYRYWTGRPLRTPALPPDWVLWLPGLILITVLMLAILLPMLVSGRSPHVMIRPEHLEIGLMDVRGLGDQVDEVIRTLNVFLG
jgi:cell division protease FtsH